MDEMEHLSPPQCLHTSTYTHMYECMYCKLGPCVTTTITSTVSHGIRPHAQLHRLALHQLALRSMFIPAPTCMLAGVTSRILRMLSAPSMVSSHIGGHSVPACDATLQYLMCPPSHRDIGFRADSLITGSLLTDPICGPQQRRCLHTAQ